MIGVDIRRDSPVATIVQRSGPHLVHISTVKEPDYTALIISLDRELVYWQQVMGLPVIVEQSDIDFLREKASVGQ